MNEELNRLLDQLPAVMRQALLGQTEDLATDTARYYLAADPVTRGDMLAFFTSEGPRRMREEELKDKEGIPTSADLRRQAKEA